MVTDNTGRMVFTRADSTTTVTVTSDIIIATQQWYHFAVVCQGSVIFLYVNGNLEGTATAVPSINISVGASLLIGSVDVPGSLQPFSGSIDSLAVYNEAIQTPISAIFENGPGADLSTDTGLVA